MQLWHPSSSQSDGSVVHRLYLVRLPAYVNEFIRRSSAPSTYATLSMSSACLCGCHFTVLLSLVSLISELGTQVLYVPELALNPASHSDVTKADTFTDVLESNISCNTDSRLAVQEFARGYGTCSCLVYILSSSNISTTSKLSSSHAMKECRRRRGIAPHILYLDPRWR
jgi:hypothetical protein